MSSEFTHLTPNSPVQTETNTTKCIKINYYYYYRIHSNPSITTTQQNPAFQFTHSNTNSHKTMPFPQLTSTPGFRITTWDPLLIISQIICLQTLYYSTLCFILLFLDILLGYTVSLDQVLLFEEVRFDTATGWGVALAYILTAGMGWVHYPPYYLKPKP